MVSKSRSVMTEKLINCQLASAALNAADKREVVGMETLDKRIVLYYLGVLGNLNNLSMQQLKLKFLSAVYLNYLCFINYLPAQLNAT